MKQKLFSVLLAITFIGIIGARAQQWQPHTSDSNLVGIFGLHPLLQMGAEFYAYNDFSWYRITDFSQPWIETSQAGISRGQQRYTRAFVIRDTIFCFTGTNEWLYSADSSNSWIVYTPNGVGPLTGTTDMRFFNMGSKRLAWWGNLVYYTTDGFNWTSTGIVTDNCQVIEDSVFRARDTTHYNIYDSNFVFLHTAPELNPSWWASNISGRFLYSYTPGCNFNNSICWDSIYRYDVLNPANVQMQHAEMPYDTNFQQCFPIYYSVADSMHLLVGNYTSPTGASALTYYMSTDNGANWALRTDMKWIGFGDIFELGDDTLYAYDNFAFNYRYSIDGGVTWTLFPNEVKALRYHRIQFSATGDTLMWYRHTDGGGYFYSDGIYRSLDGGLAWELASNGLPFVRATDSTVQCYSRSIGPYGTGATYIVWLEDIYQMYHTTDAGANWSQSYAPAPWADAVVYAGAADDEVFFDAWDANADIHHFYRSNDGGMTWTPMFVPRGDSGIPGVRYNNLMIEGRNDTLLCRFGQYNSGLYGNGFFIVRLFLSTDDGMTWTEITPPQNPTPQSRLIDYGISNYKMVLSTMGRADQFVLTTRLVDPLAAFPYAPPLMYEDSLLMFDGVNWFRIQHNGLPTDIDIQSLKYDAGIFYLGSNYGVYKSADTCETWASSARAAGPVNSVQANAGFTGRLSLYSLNKFTTNLITATDGNGIWRYDLLALNQPSGTTTLSNSSLSIFPVPVGADNKIYWSLPESADNVIVEVKDIRGAVISTSTYSDYTAGSVYSESVEGLAAGVYVLSVTADGVTQTQKLVVE
jgi:hypothetical protein